MRDRLLKRPEVEAVTGMSRAAIYKQMRVGAFPRPVRISPGAVAWRESEVQEWIGGLQKATELRTGWTPENTEEGRCTSASRKTATTGPVTPSST